MALLAGALGAFGTYGWAASGEFLSVQDALLQDMTAAKGVTELTLIAAAPCVHIAVSVERYRECSACGYFTARVSTLSHDSSCRIVASFYVYYF